MLSKTEKGRQWGWSPRDIITYTPEAPEFNLKEFCFLHVTVLFPLHFSSPAVSLLCFLLSCAKKKIKIKIPPFLLFFIVPVTIHLSCMFMCLVLLHEHCTLASPLHSSLFCFSRFVWFSLVSLPSSSLCPPAVENACAVECCWCVFCSLSPSVQGMCCSRWLRSTDRSKCSSRRWLVFWAQRVFCFFFFCLFCSPTLQHTF